MKIIIDTEEALEKGIWIELVKMFGLDEDKEVFPHEQFILTEDQAKELGLI
jgi:hypothetical protein